MIAVDADPGWLPASSKMYSASVRYMDSTHRKPESSQKRFETKPF